MAKKSWTPDKEEAAKKIIRETIDAAGTQDPASIPHRVKERLRGQATGDLDVDDYIRRVVAEQRNKR